MLTSAAVPYQDGTSWFVTKCEAIVPFGQLHNLSATEIGQRILDLESRIHAIQPYAGQWYMESVNLGTLEEVEEYIASLKEKERIRQIARNNAPYIRRELSNNYESIFIAIGRRDGFDCRACGISTDLEIDHIVAVINGGTNDFANLQLLCKTCNCKKGDRK